MLTNALIVDHHRSRETFSPDAAADTLSRRLAALGLAVTVVDAAGDDEPTHARVEGEIARATASGPTVVVAMRVWRRGQVDGLRKATSAGSTLVRYAPSRTAAALDDAFDHVLDDDGVGRLVRGEPLAAMRFAARTSKTLRENVASSANVHGAEGRVVRLATTRPRPAIQGPALGCPYLRDARTSPIFADLPTEGLQMKGCTFCLDNVGGYAALPSDEIVTSWVTQLERLRAEDPSVREVLLTDERPHPHLPALFREIAARPALAGLELLMKSRVDWLLEFADGPVSEAATLAEASGSVLAMYLVGFESFDPFHLELFNKDQTPEDNERAIEVLRALEAKFPRSFDAHRHKAHGIVLFTPWTSPEALLVNARWMRKVRFHELREDAVRTRLRLYPRTPLHRLAERDGLLASSFSGALSDRAAEQGYDASAPWRFRDPSMDAVFAAAVGLLRSVDEPTALEIAVALLARHPGLAKVPEGAPLVLAHGGWGSSLAGVASTLGARAAASDPEILRIELGQKRAALKEGVPANDAATLVEAYRAMGFAAEVVSAHALSPGDDTHTEGVSHRIVVVAKDEATVAEVLELQRDEGQRTARSVAQMGAIMGYPACCAEAFAALEDRADNVAHEKRPFVPEDAAPLDPLLNRLGPFRLVSHHLCRTDCAASTALAAALLDALTDGDLEARARATEALARPVLFVDYATRHGLDGAWDGETFVATRRTDERGRELPAGRITLSPDGAAIDGAAIPGRRPLLVVPGQALPPAARRAIAETPTRAPSLPAAIREGARAGSLVVTRVEPLTDGYAVTLSRGATRVVRVMARVGERGWAFRFEADDDPGDEAKRAASAVAKAFRGAG